MNKKEHTCAAVIGAGGAIGQALTKLLAERHTQIIIGSRKRPEGFPTHVDWYEIDYSDESSFAQLAEATTEPLETVLITCGILHHPNLKPEKSLRDVSAASCIEVFSANTIAPALGLKHFAKRLRRDRPARLAALSARVGSISDNKIGGWYSYRASKAALNMMVKTASIELARTHPKAVLATLHPGTVDSALSEPFQTHLPKGQVFRPDYAAQCLLNVLDSLGPEHSGQCFAWDGARIQP